MTQLVLDGADVIVIFEQVSGKTVTQGVAIHSFLNACLVKELGLEGHPDRITDSSCDKCCLAFPVENYENILELAWLLLKKGYHPRMIRLNCRDSFLAPTASG